jgi:hypothetical protein
MSDMNLRLIGWTRTNDEPIEPILYSVSGLTPDDHCIVGYAGIGDDDKPKWALNWYRGGQRVVPESFHDSPEDALETLCELKGSNER